MTSFIMIGRKFSLEPADEVRSLTNAALRCRFGGQCFNLSAISFARGSVFVRRGLLLSTKRVCDVYPEAGWVQTASRGLNYLLYNTGVFSRVFRLVSSLYSRTCVSGLSIRPRQRPSVRAFVLGGQRLWLSGLVTLA